MRYFAHSVGASGSMQSQAEHLSRVANAAAAFAQPFAMEEEARVAGLLHDAGKYSYLFQQRLKGLERGLDHWSPGAHIALFDHKLIAAALAIQGHHTGLQQSNIEALKKLDLDQLTERHPLGLRLTEKNTAAILEKMQSDSLTLPEVINPCLSHCDTILSAMFDVRMLFSTLVDADYLDTQKHFDSTSRPVGLHLNPVVAYEALTSHMNRLRLESKASANINNMRDNIYNACVEAAQNDVGLWTLTAPTGSGKTLSMLAFALRHAIRNKLRRIVFVIPFLSIIEQTALEYRNILEPLFGPHYIIEHHSLAEASTRQNRVPSENDYGQRLLAENWDAPIVITTSVQLLESLFSNTPSACRKLHRLAQSIILFDEVQTLPNSLVVATLAALSHLSKRYGTSIVFSTATQPAFTHIQDEVKQLDDKSTGWEPTEIISEHQDYFTANRRTCVEWPSLDRHLSWDDVASEITELKSVLCIVNLKRHARELFETIKGAESEGIYHLSTAMCPAHRTQTISDVRQLLADSKPCKMVSTQCIEAGVDLDFPYVYRAFADLTSIAQAAGRCNRNGNTNGNVKVFIPVDEQYPDGSYEQAASITKQLLRDRSASQMDIHDVDLYAEYYQRLYALAAPHQNELARKLADAVEIQDFEKVASLYRLIKENTLNILVPYGPMIDTYQSLADEVRLTGLTADWIKRARPLTISIHNPPNQSVIWERLDRIMAKHDREQTDWYIYCAPEDYDDKLGLIVPQSHASWYG